MSKAEELSAAYADARLELLRPDIAADNYTRGRKMSLDIFDGNEVESAYEAGYEQALKDVKKDIETWFEHGGVSDFFHFRYEPFEDGERCIADFDSDGAAKCLINFIIH